LPRTGTSPRRGTTPRATLPKAPTGIAGVDDISLGGLPRGRPTLVCGGAGCGKTLFAMEFLLRGASEFDEPGVFMAFEETSDDLIQNVRSLGFDLEALIARKKLSVDYVHIERSEIEETGEYDLEGLFIRLGFAIDSIGAKRVVLDTIESLFSGFSNPGILRAELRRLFRWLKGKGVTAVITGERGEGTLTRHGLEEYVSDCVIMLDHRIRDDISTRRMRVVKYRGTTHGTNEYPFLIDENGISVLPLTSIGLDHSVSSERVSSGIPELDTMLGGRGFFKGSSGLVSGGAGLGKSTVAAHFADAACGRGEHCLFLTFEESPNQVVRNMGSVGIDLDRWVRKGLLRLEAARASSQGLEMHLLRLHNLVETQRPDVVILDPITTFSNPSNQAEVDSMVLRMVDFLKSRGITAILCHSTDRPMDGGSALHSMIDAWVALRMEQTGDRRRSVVVLKARGTNHASAARGFRITSKGIEIEGGLARVSAVSPDGNAPKKKKSRSR
jgi:circadian clock protein KaiC